MQKALFWAFSILLSIPCFADQGSTVDGQLLKIMREYHVPVVGYAIIDKNKIVAANTLSIEPNIQTSTHSLFQAASITKSISAYGALRLVAANKLSLDDAVNNQLEFWKIKTNEFDQTDPVTLRQILSMTSGLSVSGFAGYEQGKPLPTLQDVLEGKAPAINPPIRVFYQPGSKYFYSGGGFEVLEKLIDDVTQQSYDVFITHAVLQPLEMEDSLVLYPLDETTQANAIPGYLLDGSMIKGGWDNYAIPASGGMWSTPTDLAKFAINVALSYHGNKKGLLPKTLAQQMLTRQKNSDYGLGVAVNGDGRSLNFRKSGHNLGYHSQLIMFPNTGQGVVIMTDSENGEYVSNFMIPFIAHLYKWPCYFPFFDELVEVPAFSC